MTNLVTKYEMGAGVSFSANKLNINFGTETIFNAGAVNMLVLGGWSRLMACASTDILLGTAVEITTANAVSVTLGDSWNYLGDHQTIAADSYSITGTDQVLLHGGVNRREYISRTVNKQKARKVLFAIVTGYVFTLGLSLLTVQFPPFKTVNDPNDNEVIELNPNGIYIIMGETLGMLCLFFAQYFIAKKASENSVQIDAVSTLRLGANGLVASVLANADHDRSKWCVTSGVAVMSEESPLLVYNTQVPSPENVQEDTIMAKFEILPNDKTSQSPVIKLLVNYDFSRKYQETYIKISDKQIFMNTYADYKYSNECNILNNQTIAGLSISLKNDNTKVSDMIIANNQINISRLAYTSNDSIEFVYEKDDKITAALSVAVPDEPLVLHVPDNFGKENTQIDSEDDISSFDDDIADSTQPQILNSPNSNLLRSSLCLSDREASINVLAHDVESGIYINDKAVHIIANNTLLAKFDAQSSKFGFTAMRQAVINDRYFSSGEMVVKSSSSQASSSSDEDSYDQGNLDEDYSTTSDSDRMDDFFNNQHSAEWDPYA